MGVRLPLLSPLQSASSLLGPPGQPPLSGGASQLPEASMWEQQNAFEKGPPPHRAVWPAAEKPGAPGSWTEKWVSAWWGGRAPVLKLPPWQPQSLTPASPRRLLLLPHAPPSLPLSLPSSLWAAQRVPAPKQQGKGQVLLLFTLNPCRGDTPLALLPSNFPFTGLPATLMGPV